MTATRKLLLSFPKSETEKPIVTHLVKDYGLIVNIFRARVTPEEFGYLVLDVTGSEQDIDRGVQFVRGLGVEVNEASVGVAWDREKCTHCGNCLPHCPTHALRIVDGATRAIGFEPGDCVECLACLTNCPFGACSSLF
jgi:L-aspartate semialdehyde sulfurtransferase ferredoxin